MRERPILFSAPMVRAILAGQKSQTRRPVKPQPPEECSIHYMLGNEAWMDESARTPMRHLWEAWGGPLFNARPKDHLCGMHAVRCPYGAPGDRLWVRETYFGNHFEHPNEPDDERELHYRADGLPCFEGEEHDICWRPSIHMPRWACRLELEVTGVRVERLQDINEADARAEGAPGYEEGVDVPPPDEGFEWSYRASFQRLWNRINGAESWDANPWVWVIEFNRVKP